MKALLKLFAVIAVIYLGLKCFDGRLSDIIPPSNSSSDVTRAFESHRSGVQVSGEGTVTRLLPDDNRGSRHQKFILRLSTNQTLLVSHNIELAPRISSLSIGDKVEFYGVYEWNSKGGLVHWTPHDPKRSHTGGWLKKNGRKYQ